MAKLKGSSKIECFKIYLNELSVGILYVQGGPN